MSYVPRWGGLIQVKDELPENLPRAVASMRRICDVIVGYDDASTDGSLEWMREHLDHVFAGEVNDWEAEVEHKAMMLEWLRAQGVDWVLWLDADEAISPPAVVALRRLAANDPSLTGICVPEINLWRSESHYRVDDGFGDAGFLRCWRMRPELRYDDVTTRRLHRHQFPEAARERMTSLRYPDEPIVHYSWSSPAKIEAKFLRYARAGLGGWNLSRLQDRHDAVLVPVDPRWFWPKDGGWPVEFTKALVGEGPADGAASARQADGRRA